MPEPPCPPREPKSPLRSKTRARSGVGAGQLRDHPLDRPARRERTTMNDDQQDAEQGGDHEQQTADDVGGHAGELILSGLLYLLLLDLRHHALYRPRPGRTERR